MKKEARYWSVQKLQENYKLINFPEYQREPNIWARAAKQRLVDSMVRGFDIASIYIYTHEHGLMDCVDGRQRLGAIMSFLGDNPSDDDNEFEFRVINDIYDDESHPLKSMDKKPYEAIKELSKGDSRACEFVQLFEDYSITIIFLSESNEEFEFNLQFTRLNLGTIINSGEKLHAMVGALRDTCFSRLGMHPFLAETRVPTRRYSREQLASQIVAQVFAFEASKQGGTRQYARTRHFDLQCLFSEYTTLDDEQVKWIEKVNSVMDLLQPAFADVVVLRNRAMVVSTVLLAYEEGVESREEAQIIAEFIDEFSRCLTWQIGRGFEMDEEYRYLVEFQRHVTQASVEKPAVAGRAEMLTQGLALWKEKRVLRGDAEYSEHHGGVNPTDERRG